MNLYNTNIKYWGLLSKCYRNWKGKQDTSAGEWGAWQHTHNIQSSGLYETLCTKLHETSQSHRLPDYITNYLNDLYEKHQATTILYTLKKKLYVYTK